MATAPGRTVELTREQVLAHRVAVHGLVERAARPTEVPVLALGVQDTPPGSLRVALSARLAEPLGPGADLTGSGAFTLVWSHRGAPHLHPTAELDRVAAACRPRDDADAAARLGWQRARMAEAGAAPLAAYREVADAVHAVLQRPLTKAELSAAVTARVSPALSPLCRPCGTHHVFEQLLRLAALAGGACLLPDSKPLVIAPLPARPAADAGADTSGVQAEYLRFHGPATDADVAGFLGTNRAAVRPCRPTGLVAVRVDGRPAEVPEDLIDTLRAAAVSEVVRLLPPSDPLLQGRDREVLVPGPAHRKALWAALGSPGALLCGAEIAGIWRPRKRGRALELQVEPFRPLGAAERAGLAAEAERLAVVRGVRDVSVTGPSSAL
ncbi:MAG TPA: winged helix DNA-binding domain-containing protein [Pseudonocardia sp.]|nr:winged helix DNA-binding domain-containing protein [Pseudonocardia sp.]